MHVYQLMCVGGLLSCAPYSLGTTLFLVLVRTKKSHLNMGYDIISY